jgi:hypothetical protein
VGTQTNAVLVSSDAWDVCGRGNAKGYEKKVSGNPNTAFAVCGVSLFAAVVDP